MTNQSAQPAPSRDSHADQPRHTQPAQAGTKPRDTRAHRAHPIPPLPNIAPWRIPPSWNTPVTTPRLILRPLQREDAQRHAEITERSRDHLALYLPWAQGPATPAIRASFIDMNKPNWTATPDTPLSELPAEFSWAVIWQPSGKLIGSIGLHLKTLGAHAVDLGYWLDVRYINKGIMTEAVAHMISRCVLPQDQGGFGLARVTISHAGTNGASGAIPRKLGLRREAWLRQAVLVAGDTRRDDSIIWGVLADEWDHETLRTKRHIPARPEGVGPHPQPWPEGDQYDPDLLAGGDDRNVVDGYRYWSMEAIRADMREHAHAFHVAVENWQHDMNIGTVVRNANAFGASAVHIVGRRTWNKRGAMVTDRYMTIHYHDTVEDLAHFCDEHALALVGIDLIPGSVSLTSHALPHNAMMLFGQEGPGLSPEAMARCEQVYHLPQVGSTRSINAGVASGAAMVMWMNHHRPDL